MKDNKDSDTELIQKFFAGDNNSIQTLYEKYINFGHMIVYNCAKSKNIGREMIDDFLLEIDFIFLRCIKSYKIGQIPFAIYFEKTINLEFSRYVVKKFKYRDLLLTSMSLDNDFEKSINLYEIIEDTNSIDPKNDVYLESPKFIMSSTRHEKMVSDENLFHYIAFFKYRGYTNKEIALYLQKSERKIKELNKKFSGNLNKKIIKMK